MPNGGAKQATFFENGSKLPQVRVPANLEFSVSPGTAERPTGPKASGTFARMRILACFGLLAAAVVCQADRLILAPTARKVPYRSARLEHMFDQTDFGRSRTMLAVGLTDAIDVEFLFEQGEGRGEVQSLDLSYNVLPALTGVALGLSVGVRDLAGKTKDGRSVYLAWTHRIGLSGRYNGDVPLDLTQGYRIGEPNGFFVGVMIPFRSTFRLLAEHDASRVNAGLEWRPLRDVGVRWIHRHEQSLWSVSVAHKF
jgi:hypothetical protein